MRARSPKRRDGGFPAGLLSALILAIGIAPLAAGDGDLVTAARAAAERPVAPLLEVKELLAPPVVRQVELSPLGDRVAALLHREGVRVVQVLDPASGSWVERFESRTVRGLAWAVDGGSLWLESPGRIAHLDLGESRPAWIWELDADREQEYLGPDPVRPSRFLLTEREEGERYRLVAVDVEGRTEILYEGDQPVGSFLLDDGGEVSFLTRAEGLELAIHRRTPTGWAEVFSCPFLDACRPVALRPDGRRLVVWTRADEDLRGLVEVDLESGATEWIHRDTEGVSDLTGVSLDPTTRQPVLASYLTDRRREVALDSRVDEAVREIGAGLPGAEPGVEISILPGAAYALVEATAARWHRPRHFLWDRERAELTELLAGERAAGGVVAPSDLADRRFFTYPAGDGRRLYGLVTIPSGIDPMEAPVVVEVHGGPWNQARPGFDGVAQILANRGYVVFEPNFRGSTGFGFDHVAAAKGEFGDGRVHRDILDGLDHLHSLGIGDPARVAMTGHSFGGFETLGAMAYSPERFRVGVASAPPIDLVRSLREIDEGVVLPHGLRQREIVEELLVDFDDPVAVAELRERSPELRVEATARPLLILAGELDDRVDVVEVKHYVTRLRELGRDVSLLIDPDAGHSFDQPAIREAWLHLTERILARYLGGRVGGEADDRLQAYLERNLLLRGDSLGPR